MLLRIGPSASVAISIDSSHSVPPTKRPRSSGPVAGPVLSAPWTGHCGASWPRRASTASATAVRSRWPRPSRPSSTGVPSASASRGERLGDLGGGRLGDHHDQVDVGVGVEAAQRLAGGEPAHRRRTGRDRRRRARGVRRRPSSVAPAWWSRVEQLLAAGAGRGDDADPARAHGVGEAQPDAVDDRGAAVGTHDERAAGGGVRLERDLLGHGHVVAEDHHVVAGLERVHRLDRGAGAGHRDERDARPGPLRRRAAAGGARRGHASCRRTTGGWGRGRRRRPRARSRRRRRRRGGARRPCRWARSRAPRSPCRSSTSRLRPVAIATCAATTPGAACTARLTWSRVTESAYAPLRSSTWSFMRALHAALPVWSVGR